MRIGVFGGSFDPVHLGHLLLADCCQRQVPLDRVLFVPAAHQPHKPRAPKASDADRLAMLRLATGDQPGIEISTVEIDRGGFSYTVDTLRAIAASLPHAELFLLMGADTLTDLPTWRDPAAICELALPVAVRRPGWPEPDFAVLAPLMSLQRLAAARQHQVQMPETPIASSTIQRLIAEGAPWQDLVPPGVAAYITAHGVYAAAPT